jgi:hypothetical protein
MRDDSVTAASADQHSYFDALLRRADHWKSVSLRKTAELAGNAWVTYVPDADTDRHRQDAAKIVVPAWSATTQLTQGASATDTTLTLVEAYKPAYGKGRIIRVDNEVMTVESWLNDTQISVTRGTNGTVKSTHTTNAGLWHSTNSLPSQFRFNLGTQDGHDYAFVWDAYWTDSYMGVPQLNHKSFQFTSGGNDGNSIWLQPSLSFSKAKEACWNNATTVGSFAVRSLQNPGGNANWLLSDGTLLGPGTPLSNPLNKTADFCIEANTWTRFIMRVRQRANDYDPVDMWLADETHDPVQVVMNANVSVMPSGLTPNSIAKFWVEFNSSVDGYLRPDNRDLVAYVRNFVGLIDVRDFDNLLVRPVPGAQPGAGPGAPSNVRIVR